LNVFIGSNASGKTTILEAVLSSCCRMIKGVTTNSDRLSLPNVFTNKDINRNGDYFEISTEVKVASDNKTEATNILTYSEKGSERRTPLILNDEMKLKMDLEGFINRQTKTLPIIKFYSANKQMIRTSNQIVGDVNYYLSIESEHKSFSPSQLSYSQLWAWDNISSALLSFNTFLNWFFNLENKELRLKNDTKNIDAELPILKSIRTAINTSLFKMYGEAFYIKSDQIKGDNSNDLFPTLVIQSERGITQEYEYLNQKSDGEKTIIALVADIAYNLAIAHDFENDNDDFLNSRGVVMIDEIETHLHPNWQRKIVPILRKVFPNIQFFITTHSPQVVSSVASESVFVCEDFKVNKVNFRTEGVDSNTLLSYIFNATERPQKYIDLINEFDKKIDAEAPEEAFLAIIEKVKEYQAEDDGKDIDFLVDDLYLRLEAHKFDMEHEMD
jgi:predicted ATP-binding protein involved in virulence